MKVFVELRVAGLLVHEGKLLLARHMRAKETYWVAPGGHVEGGEDLACALAREFLEETGLSVEVGELVMVNDVIAPSRRVLNLYFEVEAPSAETPPAGTGDAGVDKIAFFAPEELADLAIRPRITAELSQFAQGRRPEQVYLGIR